MKRLVRSALAAVAAGLALAGCATYDYGSGYAYPRTYNGYYGYDYGYDNGPYDYSPYYSGPSYYVAPSVGFGFTYRDRDHDRGNYDRDYYRHRNDNDYRRGDNDQWRGDYSRSRPMAPPPTSSREDPWGGTNRPNDRTSQQ